MNVTAKGLLVHETARDRDALARAFDVQHRASLVGFDWSEPGGALDKVREETDEVGALLGGRVGGLAGAGVEVGGGRGAAVRRAGGPAVGDEGGGEPGGEPRARMGIGTGDGGDARVADELGDLLFAVVNLARLTGVDPAAALSRATAKFEQRFAEVRRLAKERGLPMPGTPLGPLDRLWDEVKERGADRRKP